MPLDDYKSALRAGQREYRACISRGEYPYLQVLDELLAHEELQAEASLGLVDIPILQIAGTKTEGRRSAFARNFMPLLEESTEFAAKWTALCDAHLSDGIRDPIKACEFMNRFYVTEGNKRVSVLKFFGAVSVPGVVTRMIPKRRDTLESRIYYEFLDFYRLTRVNCVFFTQPGRFKALLSAVGTSQEPWDDDTRSRFFCAYTLFRRVFQAMGGGRLPMTDADALLAYLKIYGYPSLLDAREDDVRVNLSKSWKEIAVQSEPKPVELFLAPHPTPAPSAPKLLLNRLLGGKSAYIKAAFLHMKTAETSKWTYSHETGRKKLEKALEKRVETACWDSVTPESAAGAIEQAVEQGAHVIFTTTPKLMPATLRAALEYPQLKFLNCSLNMPHPSIRTYYGRMYEAKFLSGLIAGACTRSGRIGYVADYPIYGMTANVNAFALGARMVNPRAEVYLEWCSQRSIDGILERFMGLGVDMVSNQDLLSPRKGKREFGLYRLAADGSQDRMAVTFWNWGGFYERIVRSILDGGWTAGSPKAINYWWGLSAGVVDIRYTKSLPAGTKRLVEFLKESLTTGAFRPFAGKLYAQDRVIQEEGELTPEQIIAMDWLAENVRGSIPAAAELTGEAQELVRLQGIVQADREENA